MDLKKIFGTLFTLIGAVILIYAVLIVLGGTHTFFGMHAQGWKAIVVGILGLIFFTTGIGLIKNNNPRP